MLLFVLIAVVLPITNVIAQECGISYRSRSSFARIIGGKTTEKLKYPWLVFLHSQNQIEPECAGTLITPLHVVTAAHCFDKKSQLPHEIRYNVTVGVHDWCKDDRRKKDIRVEKVIIHENYDDAHYRNDIAIVKLREKINLPVVCLPQFWGAWFSRFKTRDGKILGWGVKNEDSKDMTCIVQEAHAKKYSLYKCMRTNLPTKDYFHPSLFCGGEKSIDTCYGDSGGPFLTTSRQRRHILTGITSHGYGCARDGFPGLYTNVNTFLTWIKEKTSGYYVEVDKDVQMLVLESNILDYDD